MTNEKFRKLVDEMVKEEWQEHDKKSADYADPNRTQDVLANFKEDAAECGITPDVDLLVHLKKHIRAVYKYCRTGTLASEDIKHRIKDTRNYLALLRALVEEAQNSGCIKTEDAQSHYNGHCPKCKALLHFDEDDSIAICSGCHKAIYLKDILPHL